MLTINAGYEIYPTAKADEVIKKIEAVARVCYKSEDKITDGSAEKMVGALVRADHTAMLEHGQIITVTDSIGYESMQRALTIIQDVGLRLPHIRLTPKSYSGRYIVSGNLRAWRELVQICRNVVIFLPVSLVELLKVYKPVFDDIDVMQDNAGVFSPIEPTELTPAEQRVHLDITVKFIVDRGVSHEIVRHRVASFAQESTRYCNYGKAGEVVFIEPCTLDPKSYMYELWRRACVDSERRYLTMLEEGAKPEEARDVLATSVKTEVVMTANVQGWVHFFDLRAKGTTGKPHPQMREVAVPLMQELQGLYPKLFK